MTNQPWAVQWRRLVAEAQAADAAASNAPLPLPPDAARRSAQHRRAAAQLQTQLAKHLEATTALSAAANSQFLPRSPQQLARRRQQCEGTAAQLRAVCERQLAEAQEEEQQMGAEYDAAVQSVQQLLQHAPSATGGAAAVGHGHSGAPSRQQSTAAAAVFPAAKPAAGGLPPEVAACDAFLQRHGPTGGWHLDDHGEFERILAACRGNYAHCVQLAASELGLLHSPEDVARHARWHEELQRLQLAKRLAVQRWRAERQAERAAALERQAAEEAAAREAATAEGAAARLLLQQQEREQQRAAVEAWKRARQAAAKEEQQRREDEEQDQRQREAAARQQRQQENRQALQQRQQQKQEQEAQKGLFAESSGCSAASTVLDPAARQRLQERNAKLLQRRAAAVAARATAAAEQAERLEALQRQSRVSEQFGAAECNPSRLLQPTSAVAMRQLAALSEERAAKDSGYIRHLPRRAVPAWCAGARPG